jgi:hypothetical protein
MTPEELIAALIETKMQAEKSLRIKRERKETGASNSGTEKRDRALRF